MSERSGFITGPNRGRCPVQTVLGHSDARLTLDHYAQVVTEQQRATADAMGARFIDGSPGAKRGAEPPTGADGDRVENEGEGL